MKKKHISMIVTTMFAGTGLLASGAAHAQANFVDRGNPDNALSGQCIDGTNPLCVATKSGNYVAVSSSSYSAGTNAKAGVAGIAIGDQSNANSKGGTGGGGAIAVGVGAQSLANSATAIGTVAVAAGNTSLAVGRQSAALGDFSMALGNVADAKGDRSIALGHSALAQDSQSIAIGSAVGGGNDGVSGGATYDATTQTRAAGKRAIAIGAGAVTNGDDQIAIGSGAAGANNGGTPVFGGTAAPVGGAVSFGSLAHERQLKNVAAGAADTDAVNVQQLKNVNSGLQGQIDQTNTNVTNLGTTIGGQIANINTSLSTATSNITNLQASDALSVKYDGADKSSITLKGANGTTIQGVADGKDAHDAVNVGQLDGAISPIQSSLSSAVTNIANLQGNVTNLSTSLSQTNANVTNLSTSLVGTQADVSNLQAADKRNVKYDGAEGFDKVTLQGANGTTMTNVAAGKLSADSSDAVNGSQLYATNQQVAQNATDITNLQASDKLSVKYDDAGKQSVTLGGVGASQAVALKNVADGKDAMDAVNVGQLSKATGDLSTQIDNIDQRVTNNTTQIGALQQDALQWSKSAGAYDASHGSGAAQKITNVAAGDISATSTDAINGAQLKSVQDQINGQIGGATKNAVVYDTGAQGDRLNSITLAGGQPGAVTITNVAAGALNATSADAVNGAQLYATNQRVGATEASISNISGNVTKLGDQVTAIDGRVTQNVTNIANNTTDISALKQDALQWNSTLGAYDASHGSASPQKITNVAPGEISDTSTDAVNGQQLNALKGDLSGVDSKASRAVQYDYSADGSTRLNAVTFAGGDKSAPVQLKNVATGIADTDAVNVKQLNDKVAGAVQEGTKNAVQYDVDPTTGARLNSVTLVGNGSGPVVINNVAAGKLSADSTQAVNGSQLYATNQQVSQNTQAINNLDNRVTHIENKVDDVANGKAGLVQQQDVGSPITVGKDTGGTSVNFSGTSGDRVLTGVAAGVNNNDAVNVGQLNSALKNVADNERVRATATDANTNWIARAEAGSFGSTATASGKNSVAVGQGSVADRDNSFSVGAKGNERQVTNVAAGTAPTDAVNVQQLNDNVQSARSDAKAYTDQRIGQVYNSFNDLKKDMYGGVASAMAVAGLPQPTGAGRSMVSAATANYHGQQGFAAGYSYVTENNKWVVKASVTGNSRSDFGAVVGAGYQF
ncbi:YadA-like family protein [Burkholderia sp. MSMB1589WGS]|uniref:YadA-like family protein n=1 Tax=Burkholderia sp. MSMB1589WGS TaxID=1636425 RepID=UPI0007B99A63|nr:YadA-like family protein [Burkholderia sp. MSMB1589WGS]